MDICWERAYLLAFRLYWFTLCRLNCLFFLSRMVSGEGCGIGLYRFLIIAVSSTNTTTRYVVIERGKLLTIDYWPRDIKELN